MIDVDWDNPDEPWVEMSPERRTCPCGAPATMHTIRPGILNEEGVSAHEFRCHDHDGHRKSEAELREHIARDIEAEIQFERPRAQQVMRNCARIVRKGKSTGVSMYQNWPGPVMR